MIKTCIGLLFLGLVTSPQADTLVGVRQQTSEEGQNPPTKVVCRMVKEDVYKCVFITPLPTPNNEDYILPTPPPEPIA